MIEVPQLWLPDRLRERREDERLLPPGRTRRWMPGNPCCCVDSTVCPETCDDVELQAVLSEWTPAGLNGTYILTKIFSCGWRYTETNVIPDWNLSLYVYCEWGRWWIEVSTNDTIDWRCSGYRYVADDSVPAVLPSLKEAGNPPEGDWPDADHGWRVFFSCANGTPGRLALSIVP